MKKDLIVIKENSFINKIKKIFLNLKLLFRKNKYIKPENEVSENTKVINKNNFINNIKSEINVEKVEFIKNKNIENFITDIKQNPNLLDNLSKERLIKLKEFLINDISKKEKELNKLKNNN